MLFNSIEFLIFLPIVFIVYWLVPHKFRWIPLLAASYFFYAFWNWKLVFLILFTTLVSYGAGLLLDKYNQNVKIKRLVLISAIVLCFGVLFVFKYTSFFYNMIMDIVNIFNKDAVRGTFIIMLPVGISFYTFQTASYVIDVYKGKIKSEKHFGYYALFVTYFPQLVAGPIERPENLLPQLKAEKKIKEVDYASAMRIMLVGFFKKIAVADIIGIAVNATYSKIGDANGLSILIATILFAFQIYCDFSGYSDIAMGCSKLFGVNLTENFNDPYASTSVKEFWGRWHISLSNWLKDYIYIPLGGSKKGIWRWVLAITVTFLFSGLWHGANYTFVVWGLLFAALQIIEKFLNPQLVKLETKMHISQTSTGLKIARIVKTFLIVCFCWIFFRANTIGDAGIAISKLFTGWTNLDQTFNLLSLNLHKLIYIPVALLLLYVADRIKNNSKIFGWKGHWTFRYAIYLVFAACIVCAWFYLQASNIGSSFIYFQF